APPELTSSLRHRWDPFLSRVSEPPDGQQNRRSGARNFRLKPEIRTKHMPFLLSIFRLSSTCASQLSVYAVALTVPPTLITLSSCDMRKWNARKRLIHGLLGLSSDGLCNDGRAT